MQPPQHRSTRTYRLRRTNAAPPRRVASSPPWSVSPPGPDVSPAPAPKDVGKTTCLIGVRPGNPDTRRIVDESSLPAASGQAGPTAAIGVRRRFAAPAAQPQQGGDDQQ